MINGQGHDDAALPSATVETATSQPATPLAADVLERVTDAILAVNDTTQVTYLNGAAERLLGRDRATLLGHALGDALPAEWGALLQRQITTARAIGHAVTFTARFAPTHPLVVAQLYPGADGGLTITIHPIAKPDAAPPSVADVFQRYDRLLAIQPTGVAFGHGEWFDEVNDTFLRLTGYTRADCDGGLSWRAITPPGYEEREAGAIAELRATGQARPFVKEYLRPDGSRVPFQVTIALLDPAAPFDPATFAWVGFFADHSDRAKLDHEVTARATEVETIIDTIADAVIVYGPNAELRRTNAAVDALFGVHLAPDFADLPFAKRRELWRRVTDTNGIELPQDALPQVRALRGETLIGALEMDVRVTTLYDTEVQVNVSAAPMRDERGAITGAVAVYRDVTERRRMEEVVRESEAQFRALADNIPQLAWIAAPDGFIFWYNRHWYAYTGTTPESQAGWGWRSVHDPAVLPQVMELWERSIATGEPFEMVFPLRGADGQLRPFLTRIAPVKDSHGQVTRWFGTNTDVFHLKLLEEQLAAANQMKDDFITNVGHELRTPLTSLKALLQISQQRLQRGQAIELKHLAPQAGALERLERMINDLLDATRVQTQRVELQLQTADVVTICQEVARDQGLVSGREVLLDLPKRPLLATVDRTRLHQIIGNLLANALKYTPPTATVTLRLRKERDWLLLSVSDTGPGIAPDALPYLFDRFYRAPGVTVRHGGGGGMGVGLYLTRHFVELHGGTIAVASVLGQGTTFTVRLPLSLPTDAPARAD